MTLGALRIAAPENENTLWVVDGQQRIASLASALHPEGNRHAPFAVYPDFRERTFLDRPKIVEEHHVPISALFDLVALVDWFSNAGPGAREYFAEAQRLAKTLRRYKIPAYLVRQDDEGTLIEIFDRINSYGTQLSRVEIFSALFAGPEDGADERLSLSLSRIAERVAASTGFGVIDANTVLNSILARRGADPMRDPHGEFIGEDRRVPSEFPGESPGVAYAEGEAALIRAVLFLQRDAGIPHLSLLPYKVLLVVLVRFFAHFPEPGERNRQLLRRFYWWSVVGGRWSAVRLPSKAASPKCVGFCAPRFDQGGRMGLYRDS